ncbi:30602_t:CDS:2, partial [Gigaspora margarita]
TTTRRPSEDKQDKYYDFNKDSENVDRNNKTNKEIDIAKKDTAKNKKPDLLENINE